MVEEIAPRTPIPAFSLTCHKNVDMTLTCLPTVLKHCRDPIELIIHDDGSLTPEDCDRLREGLGPVRIISRAEADDLVIPKLAGRPKLLQWRREHPFGLKMLDPALIAGGPFLLCDGDVLFLRDFEKLDRRSEPTEDLVFMADWTTVYTCRAKRRHFGPHRTKMPDFLNAGLLYCTPRAFDLDFIEWYNDNPDFSYYNWMSEQTVWAALAGRVSSFYYDWSQIDFPPASLEYRPDWVGLHFITPLRYLLKEPAFMPNLRDHAARYGEGPITTIRNRPAIYYNFAQDVVRRLYRRAKPSYIVKIIREGPIPVGR